MVIEMSAIMYLDGLRDFVQEGHPGVYSAIRQHVMDAAKFSKDNGMLPDFFCLPANMEWREIFHLEAELREQGLDPSHKYTGKENPQMYLISRAFGTWEGLPPEDLKLYLEVRKS